MKEGGRIPGLGRQGAGGSHDGHAQKEDQRHPQNGVGAAAQAVELRADEIAHGSAPISRLRRRDGQGPFGCRMKQCLHQGCTLLYGSSRREKQNRPSTVETAVHPNPTSQHRPMRAQSRIWTFRSRSSW